MKEPLYECKCCLDEKPNADYQTNNLGQRYSICKDCQRLQKKLCRKLERLGYRFMPSAFTGNQKDELLKKFLVGGILTPADLPWKLSDNKPED